MEFFDLEAFSLSFRCTKLVAFAWYCVRIVGVSHTKLDFIEVRNPPSGGAERIIVNRYGSGDGLSAAARTGINHCGPDFVGESEKIDPHGLLIAQAT
ncbi:hypothetical protein C6V83_10985 [Gordonia iterans]|uniref:Uncharacterized protein n=1 Tax=Gordonia iterans TaxID=1004901 RepID=A0A2S0KG87_9ACTN|nr:hypothetical protein C6V83_10985 [Gordonia iterans]